MLTLTEQATHVNVAATGAVAAGSMVASAAHHGQSTVITAFSWFGRSVSMSEP